MTKTNNTKDGLSTLYPARVKKITTTNKTPSEAQGRDTFATPKYATDLLIPFLKNLKGNKSDLEFCIWECAAGDKRISKVLLENGFETVTTDIRDTGVIKMNFISEDWSDFFNKEFDAIVTNPPYSIKELFIQKAIEYGKPFAFLINADYSGQSIKWISEYGCEKIIPNRRISYITPNVVNRVNKGEALSVTNKKFGTKYKKSIEVKENKKHFAFFQDNKPVYGEIEDISSELLSKYSSSQFHSMWLTKGFNLGKTETFVELTNLSIKTEMV